MNFIRPASAADASRISEIIIVNYRMNFYPFFQNDSFYFRELNVLDMAAEYKEGTEALNNTYVYDDGVVKGIIRILTRKSKSYISNHSFRGKGSAQNCWTLRLIIRRLRGFGHLNIIHVDCVLSKAWISSDW